MGTLAGKVSRCFLAVPQTEEAIVYTSVGLDA